MTGAQDRDTERRALARSALARLASPPRRVPYSLRLRLLLDSRLARTAWLFFAIAWSLTAFPLLKTDVASWMLLREPGRVTGVVERCEETSAIIGRSTKVKTRSPGRRVYANHYRFEVGARPHRGVSFETGVCLREGTTVLVEYAPADPTVSRVQGMRRAELGTEYLSIAVIPFAGLLLIVLATGSGLRKVRYLRRGELVFGTLIGSEATNFSLNGRRVMRLRFEILRRGRRTEVVVKTVHPERLEDDAREPLLFDPARPSVALAWDGLPDIVRVDPYSAVQPIPFARPLLVILPAVASVAASIFFALL